MSQFATAWNTFWFASADPYRIGVFRIVLGSYLVVYLGVLAPHAATLFSDVGVYVPYGPLLGAPPWPLAIGLFAATWVLALLFTLGYRTRLVTPLLLGGFLYHYFLYFAVKHASYDRLVIVFLVVLCCIDAGRALSLDVRAHRTAGGPIPVWAEHILRFQTIALYFGAGLWKVVNPDWRTGAFLEGAMQGMWATPAGFWVVQQGLGQPFWMVASWWVIGLELGAAALLVKRRSRTMTACALAVFHLVNTAVLFVPEFLVCLAPLALFVPADLLKRGVGGLGAGWRSGFDLGRGLHPARGVSPLDRCP